MELNKWLDKIINVPNQAYVANTYCSQTDDVRNYYLPNDTEIVECSRVYDDAQTMYDTQIYNDLSLRKDYVVMVNLLKNTRRYELDALFRRLIDHCIKHNIREQGENNNFLITPELRKSFYKFAQAHS